MLLTIAGILIVMWLIGFAFHLGGSLIHVLLVVALVVCVFHLLTTDTSRRL